LRRRGEGRKQKIAKKRKLKEESASSEDLPRTGDVKNRETLEKKWGSAAKEAGSRGGTRKRAISLKSGLGKSSGGVQQQGPQPKTSKGILELGAAGTNSRTSILFQKAQTILCALAY